MKETMYQALRGLLTPFRDKLSELLQCEIYQTVATMMSIPKDVARSVASRYFAATMVSQVNHILNEDCVGIPDEKSI